MAKNKKDVLKASRKVIDKAAAAGVSITAIAKVIQRLDQLQKDRDGLESKLVENSDDAKVVWKALRAELKGLEAELEGAQQAKKTVTKAAPKVSAPKAVAPKVAPKASATKPPAKKNPPKT